MSLKQGVEVLVTLLLLNATYRCSALINLARGKPATASSVYGPLPGVAADGLPYTDWKHDSCFAVKEGDNHPWWQVDLEAYSRIIDVAVTSRSDCCPERLHDFTIEVFTKNPSTETGARATLCGTYNGAVTVPGKTVNVKCVRPVKGRYVRLKGKKNGSGDLLQFCEVKVFGSIIAGANLAEGKPATASSVYGPLPGVAADGLPYTDWKHGSCFAVKEGDNHPWWQVDLEAYSRIIDVAVTSRSDCCPERLHDFTLEVFTKNPATEHSAKATLCGTYNGAVTVPGKTVNVKCVRPVKGRYVRLKGRKNGTGDLLQFCEVKVFGSIIAGANLAEGKPATASSVYGPLPGVAADGLPYTDWKHGSCFAVKEGDNHPWWQVDLEAYSRIIDVAVTSRSDCCPERLHDFTLEVFTKNPAKEHSAKATLCGTYNGAVTVPGKTVNVKCVRPVKGRYVRLKGRKNGTGDLLQFCEVKVFGSIIAGANLAEGKPATASSVYGPLPGVAADGLPYTDWKHGSCFAVKEGDNHPWWQVDLEAYSRIIDVAVTSRSDCCPERLHDFTLEVFTKNPATEHSAKATLCGTYNGAVTVPGKTVNVKCVRPVKGRYVRLKGRKNGTGDLLQFCEVKVFGYVS